MKITYISEDKFIPKNKLEKLIEKTQNLLVGKKVLENNILILETTTSLTPSSKLEQLERSIKYQTAHLEILYDIDELYKIKKQMDFDRAITIQDKISESLIKNCKEIFDIFNGDENNKGAKIITLDRNSPIISLLSINKVCKISFIDRTLK